MKRINLILLIGLALICSAEGAGNSEDTTRYDRSWGKLNYTAFSHLDVTFDQADLRRIKTSMISGSLKIPNGVTHVYLKLSGTFDFIEFPETVKFVNKDIFNGCNVKTILLNDKTVKRLLSRKSGENAEESIRKYFSLNDNIAIIVDSLNGIQKSTFSAPETPNATPGNPFLNEIQNFDRNKLKHNEESKTPNATPENPFLNEIQNFDRNKLKHNEEPKTPNATSENPFLNKIQNSDKNKLKYAEKAETPKEAPKTNFLNEIQNFDKNKLKHQESQERPKTLDPLAKGLLEKIEYKDDDINKSNLDDADWED